MQSRCSIILRGIQGNRELALHAEEHQLLLSLIPASEDGGHQAYLWREHENARWLQRTHHWVTLSVSMQFLLHANFRIASANERQMLAVYSQVLLTQLQRHLRQSIPTDLEKIVNNPDEQAAARELVRLVTMGFYAKLFDSWVTGKQEYKNCL